MQSTYKKWLLLIAIIFQAGILLGMYLQAQYPLWNGVEIKVAVKPVDPRSLFRGNYALLNYSISTVSIDPKLAMLAKTDKPNPRIIENMVVYTRLQKQPNGLYEAIDMQLNKPETGLFIRGRLQSHSKLTAKHPEATIKYGIEAFFAPKKRALEIENSARWRANSNKNHPPAIVTLMLSKSGKGAIKSLQIQ